jgi:hypothetical protein
MGSLLFWTGCDERGEQGGRHGDIDMAQEESFQEAVDLPPYITDPMQIEQALKSNPESEFFGWSHLFSVNETESWGHVFYGYGDEKKIKARVTLSNTMANQQYVIGLAKSDCSSDGLRNLESFQRIGVVGTDAQGRIYSEKIAILKNRLDIPLESECSNQNLITLAYWNGQPVSCGLVECVKQNVRSEAH